MQTTPDSIVDLAIYLTIEIPSNKRALNAGIVEGIVSPLFLHMENSGGTYESYNCVVYEAQPGYFDNYVDDMMAYYDGHPKEGTVEVHINIMQIDIDFDNIFYPGYKFLDEVWNRFEANGYPVVDADFELYPEEFYSDDE